MAASDLTIVIPTRDRWDILARTLAGLRAQTVRGFEIVVAVDGEDQQPPDLGDVRVVVRPAGGSGATRNAGVAEVRTTLTMLLDDDMIPMPDMVERHLERHESMPEEEVAVLGRAVWHPELRPNRVSRWLDWSGLMFEYEALEGLGGTDVGWGRFYSCNVSFKTSFFRAVGGFDETFVHYYEDTDLAKRMGGRSVRVVYEPAAVTQHLQRFDWRAVQRRFDRVAIGERLMVHKHPDFDAWFQLRMRAALQPPRPLPVWPHVVDAVPRRTVRLRRAAERRAHQVYLSRLAPSYLAAFRRAGVLGELKDYLGDEYDPRKLIHNESEVDREADEIGDEATFYRNSRMYLYNLAVFEMSPTKEPYRAAVTAALAPGARILDYGCGIGSDGLAFAQAGFEPAFADFANPSTEFLRWRLARRGRSAPVYDIDRDEVPGGFDAVVSFDVIEHLEDPSAYLARLESLASVVAVNFLEPDPYDTHLHRPLPVDRLVARARQHELLQYHRYYGRSHLVVYATRRRSATASWRRYAEGRAQIEAARVLGSGPTIRLRSRLKRS